MLSIYGKPTRYCDGIARRGFLRIGGFTMGSVVPASLSGLMRAQAASPGRSALDRKAVINIFLILF